MSWWSHSGQSQVRVPYQANNWLASGILLGAAVRILELSELELTRNLASQLGVKPAWECISVDDFLLRHVSLIA